MIEQSGNLWRFHTYKFPDDFHWVVITTNGTVKNGYAVLGRGIAAQAVARYPQLPRKLGARLRGDGNQVYAIPEWMLIAMPVKHNWWERANLSLIHRSCLQLVELVNAMKIRAVYMPRPGCGNGGLTWEEVRPICAETLDNRFHVVQLDLL